MDVMVFTGNYTSAILHVATLLAEQLSNKKLIINKTKLFN
jgi:hypothetical protein